MLTESEIQRLGRFLRFCSILVPYPVNVNVENWDFNLRVPTWRKLVCWISYCAFVLHTLYKNYRLVQSFFIQVDTPLYQIMVHLTLAFSAIMVVFWYMNLFFIYPEIHVAVTKMTMEEARNGCHDDSTGKGKFGRYTLQDLMAISLPFTLLGTIGMITIAFNYDRSLPLLLFSSVPMNWNTNTTFFLCLLEEIRFMCVLAGTAAPIWQLHVIIFDVCGRITATVSSNHRGSYANIQKDCSRLRSLQLYLNLVNIVHRNMNFTFKVLSLSICITNGYAAVAHFKEMPVFGMMYAIIFTNQTLIYSLIYQKAFALPDGFNEALNSLQMSLRTTRKSHPIAAKLRREIKSIRKIGIKVGDFHTMERASTPIFIDFIFKNIVNMLVATK